MSGPESRGTVSREVDRTVEQAPVERVFGSEILGAMLSNAGHDPLEAVQILGEGE